MFQCKKQEHWPGIQASVPLERQVTLNTGERLKKLRKERGVSVFELANIFNCSRQYIHSLERSGCPVSRRMLQKYCDYFNTSANFILGMEETLPSRAKLIPVFSVKNNELHEESSMSIPSAFLKDEREYFAIMLDTTRIIVLERDRNFHFQKQGVFEYQGLYYFSKLERYPDGSIWLISEGMKRPEQIKEINKLNSLGYQSYQLA